jgi:hypothetical protein
MDRPVPQRSLKEERERTIVALCTHFAEDRLEVAELEARLDSAHRAKSAAELAALLEDLPAARPADAAAAQRAGEAAPHPHAGTGETQGGRETRVMAAVMGGVDRKGHWLPARRNLVLAIMGGASLDFREVDLPPGETEVVVFCLMGGAEIIVPPGLRVDASGIAILGGFDDRSPLASAAADAAILKLSGVAIMGGVEVTVREPGESAGDARRRRQREKRLPGDGRRGPGA